MYYLLSYNIVDEKKDPWFNGEIYDRNKKPLDNMFLFSTGKRSKEAAKLAPFTIVLDEKESKYKKRKFLDKICTIPIGTSLLFLISPKAKEVFEKLKLKNIEYFDVKIKGKDLTLDDYSIANITTKLECIDTGESEIEFDRDGDIRSFEKLVLKEKMIPKDVKMFLLGPKLTAIEVVHEDVKKAIEESGLTGFKFIELEDAGNF